MRTRLRKVRENEQLRGRVEGTTVHFKADLQRRTLEVRVGTGVWSVAKDAAGKPQGGCKHVPCYMRWGCAI